MKGTNLRVVQTRVAPIYWMTVFFTGDHRLVLEYDSIEEMAVVANRFQNFIYDTIDSGQEEHTMYENTDIFFLINPHLREHQVRYAMEHIYPLLSLQGDSGWPSDYNGEPEWMTRFACQYRDGNKLYTLELILKGEA